MKTFTEAHDLLPPRVHSTRQRSYRFYAFGTIFLIVILEGALRKWLSEGLTNVCLLTRDLICLAYIGQTFLNNEQRRASTAVSILKLWTVLLITWGLIQLLINQSSPLMLILGLRFWLLYLWFAAAVYVSFDREDTISALRLVWYCALGMMALTVTQHFLPPSHVLNSLPESDEGNIMMVSGNIVRTTGTFSFSLGLGCFMAIATPILLAPKHAGINLLKSSYPTALLLGLVAVITMALVSGSRGALINSAILISLWTIAVFVTPNNDPGASTDRTAALLVLPMVALSALIFSDAIVALSERFISASESESMSERFTSIMFGEPDAQAKFDLLGFGLGAGSNAAAILSGLGRVFALAETEPGRVILEGGVIGIIWQLAKFTLVTAGLGVAINSFLRNGNNLSILLWISTANALLSWPSSGQITANAMAYILLAIAGLSLLNPHTPQQGQSA